MPRSSHPPLYAFFSTLLSPHPSTVSVCYVPSSVSETKFRTRIERQAYFFDRRRVLCCVAGTPEGTALPTSGWWRRKLTEQQGAARDWAEMDRMAERRIGLGLAATRRIVLCYVGAQHVAVVTDA
jgi:hypothetical protein